jgi:hypothetical protein
MKHAKLDLPLPNRFSAGAGFSQVAFKNQFKAENERLNISVTH